MKLPTIDLLTRWVMWFSLWDLAFFFYSASSGFWSDLSIVVVFCWLALAMLVLSASMVVNAVIMKRIELLVYFLSLYIRLFALAFHMIALGIGVSHSTTLSAVVTYVLLGSTLIAELTVYGFLLVQLDDLSAITEPDVPTDIEGAGTLTKHLTGVNSWTTAVFQFLLVMVPFYGPLLLVGREKKRG